MSRPKQRDTTTTFRLSKAEKKRWQAAADAQDVPLSQLIRHVMNDFCKSLKKSKK